MNQYKVKNSLLCCLLSFVLLVSASAAAQETYSERKVYVGGMPFGVRFHAGEVSVIRTNDFLSDGKSVSPAAEAGILANDVIESVNAHPISSVQDITAAVNLTEGQTVKVSLRRGDKNIITSITPRKCDETGEFRLGIMLKDSSAGIGTVTFIEDNSFVFAGLGHGICDTASGDILHIDNGYISHVKINGINKGVSGTPGELRGNLEADKCGKLLSNTEVGVYGIFTDIPALSDEPTPVANQDEVTVGAATILCTLDDNKCKEYSIEIAEINHNNAAKTKNYVVKVTDKRLLAKTGGIVQGMSGSPILQNGKLVGAITHVMINDPTTGYGIYIGNMLDELEKVI